MDVQSVQMDASDPAGTFLYIADDVLGADDDIKDLTVDEYKNLNDKSCFYRPAAFDPAMDASGSQCSLFEKKQ